MNDRNYMSVLEQAERELIRRAALAQDPGDWQESCILEPLAGVADYVKRIGDHRDSARYRAEKAGPLLAEARRVHLKAMLAFAGWPDDETPTAQRLHRADQLLEQVTTALRSIMWSAACSERGAPDRSDTSELEDVARRLHSYAAELTGLTR